MNHNAQRISNIIPEISLGMPNEDAYELIANKLEAQEMLLKLAVETLEVYANIVANMPSATDNSKKALEVVEKFKKETK